jgi:hypothetical protein
MRRPLLAVMLAAAAAAMPARAAADEDAPPEAAPPPRPPPTWAVGFNPAAVTIGRYGVDVLHHLGPHVAGVGNLHVDYGSRDWPSAQYDDPDPFYGLGGELGLRFFPAGRGMAGFFMGPSLLARWTSVPYRNTRIGMPAFGVAVDVGGQINLGAGVFLVLGGGLEGTWTSTHPSDIAGGIQTVSGNGIRPRFLLTLGMLFR